MVVVIIVMIVIIIIILKLILLIIIVAGASGHAVPERPRVRDDAQGRAQRAGVLARENIYYN